MIKPLKYSYLNKEYFNLPAERDEEYSLWYEGNSKKLLKYYRTRSAQDGYESPNFYRLAPVGSHISMISYAQQNNFVIYHIPMANTITTAMTNLILNSAPVFNLYSGNKIRDEQRNAELVDILDRIEINSTFVKSAHIASYSGSVSFKFVIDKEFSDDPILQLYGKEDVIINKKYDRIVSLVFKDYYEYNKEDYTLLSEYGKGYIRYSLIDSKGSKVELNTLEETADLKDVIIINESGEPLDYMLAVHLENKPGGLSDYVNLIDDFMALDETYSNMMNYIRNAQIKTKISQNNLRKDEQSGMDIIPQTYGANYEVLWDSSPDGMKDGAKNDPVPELNNAMLGYQTAINDIIKRIAKTCGLSVKTLLGDDTSGANSSADALIIRENDDFKTYSNKSILWVQSLKKIIKLVLNISNCEVSGITIKVPEIDTDVNVELFNPTSKPLFMEILNETKELEDLGAIDLKEKLKRIWVDTGKKTQEEVDEMYKSLQQESGIEGVKEEKLKDLEKDKE